MVPGRADTSEPHMPDFSQQDPRIYSLGNCVNVKKWEKKVMEQNSWICTKMIWVLSSPRSLPSTKFRGNHFNNTNWQTDEQG